MMRKSTIAVTLIALSAFVCSGTLLAKEKSKSPRMEIGGFYSYLDAKDAGDVHGLGGKLKFNLLKIISIDGRVSYMELDNSNVEMIPLEAAACVNIPIGSLRPYAGLGAGYYMFSAGDIDLDDEIGLFPLVGLQVNLGKNIGIFGEARWLYLESDVKGSREEAEISGAGFNLGVSLLF